MNFKMKGGVKINTSIYYISHYGVGHLKGGHSGRYEWGSGGRPYQRTSMDGQKGIASKPTSTRTEKDKKKTYKEINKAYQKGKRKKDYGGSDSVKDYLYKRNDKKLYNYRETVRNEKESRKLAYDDFYKSKEYKKVINNTIKELSEKGYKNLKENSLIVQEWAQSDIDNTFLEWGDKNKNKNKNLQNMDKYYREKKDLIKDYVEDLVGDMGNKTIDSQPTYGERTVANIIENALFSVEIDELFGRKRSSMVHYY